MSATRKRTRVTAFGYRPYNTIRARKTVYGARRSRIVPGFTRYGGAYKRSLPYKGGAGPEKKYQDVDLDAVAIAAGGVFLNTDSFVKIAQGTTKNTRIGNKISVCDWNVHGVIILPASATATAETVRIIIGIDKQANGAVPNVTDILEVAEYDSFRAMDFVDRFTILKDKWITLNPQVAAAAAGQQNRTLKWRKKNMKLPIHYSSTAGAITELRSNSLFILCIGSLGNAQIDAQSRVKFFDL